MDFLFVPLSLLCLCSVFFFFFFNDTATTEIYTLSLHDALPICSTFCRTPVAFSQTQLRWSLERAVAVGTDRKSTRLNSSHLVISYAVFCLKKKKNIFRSGINYIFPVLAGLLHLRGSHTSICFCH